LDLQTRDQGPVVHDIAINGLTKRVILTAGAVSQACSYFGAWDFALVIGPLMGRRSASARLTFLRALPPYSESQYQESTSASLEELVRDPEAIHERLLGRLNRAFGGDHRLVPK
jgi:hypothetical protein